MKRAKNGLENGELQQHSTSHKIKSEKETVEKTGERKERETTVHRSICPLCATENNSFTF